jgi:hypothetical protein
MVFAPEWGINEQQVGCRDFCRDVLRNRGVRRHGFGGMRAAASTLMKGFGELNNGCPGGRGGVVPEVEEAQKRAAPELIV